MRHFLRTTLSWILLAFLGEPVVAPLIAIGGIAPDFTVIALVILAGGTIAAYRRSPSE